jgi:hypothetical protein
MTTASPVPENPTSGLTPIVGDHEVAVTGAEHHQDALARYAPNADGRARHVAVELVPAPVTRGAHAGLSGIEARLDGVRIGELTAREGQRYAALVDDVLRQGGRPSCLADVGRGEHGLKVVLHLPDLRTAAPPRPAVGAGGAPDVLPGRAATGARYRAPLLIGVVVVGLLGLMTAIGVGGGDIAALSATGATAAPTSAAVPPPTPAPATVAPPPPVAQPEPPPVTESEPQPEREPERQPEREPEPPPEPEPTPRRDCNPNYSGGCVPNAKDVDCEGGPGDGPKYVRGPLRATGEDVYGLDGDNDGVACENGGQDRG